MGEPIRYWDFHFAIEQGPDRGYRCSVRSSPRDTGSEAVQLDLPPEVAETVLIDLERIFRGKATSQSVSRAFRDFVCAEEPELDHTPVEIGKRLGEALSRAVFARVIRDLWVGSISRVEGQSGRGLRVRIELDPARPEFPFLASLPWELLQDPVRRGFLSQDVTTPVVRKLTSNAHRARPRLLPPLRVLLVMAQPRDKEQLGLGTEQSFIGEAFAGTGEDRIKVDVLEPATLTALRGKLHSAVYHVIHFMGHGGFDPSTGEAGLVFEHDDRTSHFVGADLFRTNLRQAYRPALIVLNACDSGTLPRHLGMDPYSGVATALTLDGYGAVLGMQFSISDRAAIAFSRSFYRSLALKDPIDRAVCEARIAVQNELGSDSMEWATPCLFLRTDDGEIFSWLEEEGDDLVMVETRPHIGIRTFLHELDPMEATIDDAHMLSLVKHFQGRAINSPELWESEILPETRDFLRKQLHQRHDVSLQIDAHISVAFLAGFCVNQKASVHFVLRQRTPAGLVEWALEGADLAWSGPDRSTLWKPAQRLEIGSGCELAVAVSVTHSALAGGRPYVEEKLRQRVGQLLHFEIAPAVGGTAVRSGGHAVALADELGRQLRDLAADIGGVETLHWFIAAPVGFVFCLGRVAQGLGRAQLYEWPFERGIAGAYTPSLLLDPAQLESIRRTESA